MGVGGQRHAPAALLPGKTRYPMYRRLGGPQGQSGWVQKIWLYSFFNLSARLGWVVNATPQPLYCRERPGTQCIGGWVGPRACLDGCSESRPHRDSNPDRPARSKSLYWLSYPSAYILKGRHENKKSLPMHVVWQVRYIYLILLWKLEVVICLESLNVIS